MKILSIDIGIKNMAYCLFDNNELNDFNIIKWDICDISEKKNIYLCQELNTKKQICNKCAEYEKNEKYYCKTHSKKQVFQIPILELKQSKINKYTIKQLYDLANKYNIEYKLPIKKIELIELLTKYTNTTFFNTIEKNINKTLKYVEIGKNMKNIFDELFGKYNNIDYVLIENQLGPSAMKMTNIQYMVSQYFITMNNTINIEFISPCNKLKDFNIDGKLNYKQRKQMSTNICLNQINNSTYYHNWIEHFNKHKKRDDLADCFLQGLWFINNKI
jgi:hypothetical protein